MDTSKLKLKAEKSISMHNYKLAQVCYQQVCESEPQDLESRTSLRAVNIKLLEDNKNKVPTLKLAPLNIKIGMAGKNYLKILNLTEKYLGMDPKNIKILIKQGMAALELDYIDTAIFCFEQAHHVDAKATEPLRLLVNALKMKGGREFLKKAVDFAHILREVDPKNKEVQEMCKNVDAELAQLSFKKDRLEDAVKDKDETSAREKDEQIIHSDEDALAAIKRINEKLVEDGNNPNLYEKLGDLYLRLKKYDECKKAYNKSLSLNAANTSVMVKLGDIDINRLTHEIAALTHELKKDPENSEIKEKIKKANSKRHVISVREYEKRVENQPTVNKYKFELGKLYYVEERVDDSIRLFQTTSKEPKFRTESLVLLGKLFSKKSEFELALNEFDEALSAMVGFNNQKKDTLYSKADALEKLKRYDEAKSTFQSIMVEDIGFKDVSKRVEKLKEVI